MEARPDEAFLKTGVSLVVDKAKKIASAAGSPLAPLPISALLQVLIETPAFKDRVTRTAVLSECVHKTRGLFQPHPTEAFALQWRDASLFSQNEEANAAADGNASAPAEAPLPAGAEANPPCEPAGCVSVALPMDEAVVAASSTTAAAAAAAGRTPLSDVHQSEPALVFEPKPTTVQPPIAPPASQQVVACDPRSPAVPSTGFRTQSYVGTPRAVCVTGPLHRALFHPTSASSELREKLNKALEGDKATAELLALFAEVPEGATPKVMKNLDCTPLYTKLVELAGIATDAAQRAAMQQQKQQDGEIVSREVPLAGPQGELAFETKCSQVDSYVGTPTHVCIGGWLYHVLQHPEVCPRSKVVGSASHSVNELIDQCLQAGNGECPAALCGVDCTELHEALKKMVKFVSVVGRPCFTYRTRMCLNRRCNSAAFCPYAHSAAELRAHPMWVGFEEAPFIASELYHWVARYINQKETNRKSPSRWFVELDGVLKNDPEMRSFVKDCFVAGPARVPSSFFRMQDRAKKAAIYGRLCEMCKKMAIVQHSPVLDAAPPRKVRRREKVMGCL